MIKLCVFDLAGTTINDDGGVVAEAFRMAFTKAGFDLSKDLVNKYMGFSKPEAIANILTHAHIDLSYVEQDKIHNDFIANMIDYYDNYTGNLAIDGARKVFTSLHDRGIKVAVNTGFSRPIVDVILSKLGWSTNGLVDVSVTSDEVYRGRPEPYMIQKIMSTLLLTNPEEVAKIGDTPADLLEGVTAGCGLVVGVTEGSHTKDQLEEYYHTHLIPNITHLIPLL